MQQDAQEVGRKIRASRTRIFMPSLWRGISRLEIVNQKKNFMDFWLGSGGF
jgi:hypothetical protein